jgi:hypothetical protein
VRKARDAATVAETRDEGPQRKIVRRTRVTTLRDLETVFKERAREDPTFKLEHLDVVIPGVPPHTPEELEGAYEDGVNLKEAFGTAEWEFIGFGTFGVVYLWKTAGVVVKTFFGEEEAKTEVAACRLLSSRIVSFIRADTDPLTQFAVNLIEPMAVGSVAGSTQIVYRFSGTGKVIGDFSDELNEASLKGDYAAALKIAQQIAGACETSLKVVSLLAAVGLAHGDLHTDNVTLSVESKVATATVIDIGKLKEDSLKTFTRTNYEKIDVEPTLRLQRVSRMQSIHDIYKLFKTVVGVVHNSAVAKPEGKRGKRGKKGTVKGRAAKKSNVLEIDEMVMMAFIKCIEKDDVDLLRLASKEVTDRPRNDGWAEFRDFYGAEFAAFKNPSAPILLAAHKR